VVYRVVHGEYLGRPSKPSAPNASLNLEAKASYASRLSHTETVKKSYPRPRQRGTKAWGSGMGDPLAELVMYFSAVNAGGRYTTAIAMATSPFAPERTEATWIRRMETC
jgi:hypothetical protein